MNNTVIIGEVSEMTASVIVGEVNDNGDIAIPEEVDALRSKLTEKTFTFE